MASDKGGRLSRAWQKEQQAWTDRPHYWKFWLLQAAVFLMIGLSASLRDDRGFLALAVVGLLVAGSMATLAYRASHPR